VICRSGKQVAGERGKQIEECTGNLSSLVATPEHEHKQRQIRWRTAVLTEDGPFVAVVGLETVGVGVRLDLDLGCAGFAGLQRRVLNKNTPTAVTTTAPAPTMITRDEESISGTR
jgi:hypothetical protein